MGRFKGRDKLEVGRAFEWRDSCQLFSLPSKFSNVEAPSATSLPPASQVEINDWKTALGWNGSFTPPSKIGVNTVDGFVLTSSMMWTPCPILNAASWTFFTIGPGRIFLEKCTSSRAYNGRRTAHMWRFNAIPVSSSVKTGQQRVWVLIPVHVSPSTTWCYLASSGADVLLIIHPLYRRLPFSPYSCFLLHIL